MLTMLMGWSVSGLGQAGGGNWEELVGAGVVLVIMVGSWIMNVFRKAAEQRRANQRRMGMDPDSGSAAGTQTGPAKRTMSLDELAAQRRAELAQARQPRNQAPAPGSVPAPGSIPARGGSRGDANALGRAAGHQASEPTNLTMAQRIERARARAAYEQRATQLRRADGGGAGDGVTSGGGEAETAQRRLDQARQQALQRQEEQRRLAQQRATAAQAEQQRQRSLRDVRPQPQRRPSQSQRPRPQSTPVQGSDLRSAQGRSDRNLPPAAADTSMAGEVRAVQAPASVEGAYALRGERADVAVGSLMGQLRNPRALRQVVVLKEIMDRPLALREPSSGAWE
jgi:hypothetical protein